MNCDKCGMNRKYFVPGSGPEKTKLAILGEAPGRTEARDKVPFVGASGKLLFQVLAQVGLKREDIYVTNVVKCWPSGNAKPTDAQMACCAGAQGQLLIEEFREREIKLVIALGNTALTALTGLAGITRQRGHIKRATMNKELFVLPVVHPAAVLRNVGYFGDFARDLKRAAGWLPRNPTFDKAPIGEILVIEDVGEAIAYLYSLRDRPVVFDIETSGFSPIDDYILSAVFSRGPTDATVITGDAFYTDEVQAVLREVMEDPARGIEWIMHNGQFDVAVTMRQLGARATIGFDTLLAHYALDENSTHDLKVLAHTYLGAPDWEADIKKYLKHPRKDSYAILPPDVLHRYNGLDGMYTYQLYEVFKAQLEEEENQDLHKLFYELLMPATNALVDLTHHGIRVDSVRLEELKVKATTDAREASVALAVLIGRPFNPNSPIQVAKILYDELKAPTADKSLVSGVPPELTAPAGLSKVSPRTTAMFQLERLTYHGGKVAAFSEHMIQYRHSSKLASTYLSNYAPGADGRIHPSYLLFGTVTGRLSSTRPNVLNMPHIGGIRGLIIPSEGNVILAVDYGQNELRVLAALSGAEGLVEIFKSGQDIHDEVTTDFYGSDYSKKQRMIAKSFNFGLVYGRGARSMGQAFGIAINEAQTKMGRLRNRMGIAPWISAQHKRALTNGFVGTPLGRRRRFPLITAQNVREVERQSVNAPVQGTGSDLMILSLIEINKWIRDYGGLVLYPVHDSIYLEVPGVHLIEIAKRVKKTMLEIPQRCLNTDIPWVVDVEYGPSAEEDDLMKLEGV